MPSAQPICAARIIRSQFMKSGWGAILSKETNEAVSNVKEEANGMYQMQISRARDISSTSLRTALFWERRNVPSNPLVGVALPALNLELEVDLFCDGGSFENGLDAIRKAYHDNMPSNKSSRIDMHPMFGPMRDRPYTFWPIDIDGVWVTVVLQIESLDIPSKDAVSHRDRRVSRYTIIDPLQDNRMARRELLQDRLPQILEEGCIEFNSKNPNVATDSFLRLGVQESWATGLISYAVCRELFRRLRVIDFRWQQQKDGSHSLLWSEFEENFNLDWYRQSLMAACAHQTIEKSRFLVRMALEVPSEKAEHNPDALKSSVAYQPDEVYGKKDNSARTVSTKFHSKEFEIGTTPSSDSFSDDGEVDKTDEMDESYESDESVESDGVYGTDGTDETYRPDEDGADGVTGVDGEVMATKFTPLSILNRKSAPLAESNEDRAEKVDRMDVDGVDGEAVTTNFTPICTLKQEPARPAAQEPQPTNGSSSTSPKPVIDAEIMPPTKRSLDDEDESSSKRQCVGTGCDDNE
ncbi:hypothetical protein F5B19DRAFT_479271 [Rostrohypoxylon terebratum]|nr:hypothetical protein F5B19DRAFT_479271 [Rostrohypoxylon terebratum]